MRALLRSRPGGGTFHIEDVQDQVELGLMRGGHHEVARAYVLYRERRTQERARQGAAAGGPRAPSCMCIDGGQRVPLDMAALQRLIESACAGLGADVKADPILAETTPQPVRRRADRRGLQGLHPGRPHADREGPGLHPRHRAPAAAHHPPRECWATRCTQAQMGRALRRVLPAVHQEGRAGRAAGREAAAVRPGPAGRGAEGRARPAVRLPRPADAVRPLLPAHRRDSASSCRRPSSCAWPWAWR